MANALNKLLLLTLVHPDFLPPVYATAQSLRDLNYDITIITFDSFVPAPVVLGERIEIVTMGKHHNVSLRQRLKLRSQFRKYAAQRLKDGYKAIVSFCPFSFNTANAIKGSTPNIYFAMEIADFKWEDLRRSPLTAISNFKALRSLEMATLVATPSFQRSAWLAGRSRLREMPATILNTAYVNGTGNYNADKAVLHQLLPEWVFTKKMVLYTGAVNDRLCVKELVAAFIAVNDPNCVLLATGFKDNAYCKEVKQLAENSAAKKNIFLLPYVTREEMLALQGTAHIGACLMKEIPGMLASQMIAPNKTGEYLNKGLYILGVKNFYMDMFAAAGVGSLADTAQSNDIAKALRHAIKATDVPGYRDVIVQYLHQYFCMQQQVGPIVRVLGKV